MMNLIFFLDELKALETKHSRTNSPGYKCSKLELQPSCITSYNQYTKNTIAQLNYNNSDITREILEGT